MLPLLEKIIKVDKPASGLPKSLLAQYEATAVSSGFRVEPQEKGFMFIGKTVTVALKVEFGNRWEFFNTITSLRETPADIKVLATSSNAKSISMEAVYTVLKKKLQEKTRWVLIDIEKKKEPMFLNFSLVDLGEKAPARLKEKAKLIKPEGKSAQEMPFRQDSPGKPAPAALQPGEKAPIPTKPKEGIERAPGQKKGPLSFLSSLPFFWKKKAAPPSPIHAEKGKGMQGHAGGEKQKEPERQAWRETEKGKGRGKESKEPALMKKSKNYGMQPADAKPRKKKIYGKRAKKQD